MLQFVAVSCSLLQCRTVCCSICVQSCEYAATHSHDTATQHSAAHNVSMLQHTHMTHCNTTHCNTLTWHTATQHTATHSHDTLQHSTLQHTHMTHCNTAHCNTLTWHTATQHTATHSHSTLQHNTLKHDLSMLQFVAVSCSLLQCVVLQCVAECCVAVCHVTVLQCVVLQCRAVCCSVVQVVAGCCSSRMRQRNCACLTITLHFTPYYSILLHLIHITPHHSSLLYITCCSRRKRQRMPHNFFSLYLILLHITPFDPSCSLLQCRAVCCSVVQVVAGCCSSMARQRISLCLTITLHFTPYYSILLHLIHITPHHSSLLYITQHVAVCCSWRIRQSINVCLTITLHFTPCYSSWSRLLHSTPHSSKLSSLLQLKDEATHQRMPPNFFLLDITSFDPYYSTLLHITQQDCTAVWITPDDSILLHTSSYYYSIQSKGSCSTSNCLHEISNFVRFLCLTIWSKEIPPPGGASYLLCSLIKNRV